MRISGHDRDLRFFFTRNSSSCKLCLGKGFCKLFLFMWGDQVEIGICDDENTYCDVMISYCKKAFGDSETRYHVFHSGEELLASKMRFDYLFLDIEMPGTDGISVKNMLQDARRNDKIIFLTSHEERMKEAFGTNVLDFISKPIDESEVKKVFSKIIKMHDRQTISITVDGTTVKLPYDKILYVEAEDKYVSLHTTEKSYLLRQTMNEWSEILPEPFFCRCSRFCIINMNYYNQKRCEAIIGSKVIPVGRAFKKNVSNTYLEFLRRKDE